MSAHIPEQLYKDMLTQMPIVCIDLVIQYKGKFLLVKRSNKPAQGKWWFPGGRLLKNETFEEAVARKLNEETGLEVDSYFRLSTDNTIFPDGPFGTTTHSVNVTFQVTPTSANAAIDEQSETFGWFSEIDEEWDPYIKNLLRKPELKICV